MRPPPRVVLAPGVYRSASTWAANVVAELLRRRGAATLLYADTAAALAQETGGLDQAVVKMHQPDASMALLAHLSGAPVVMTVRDPRDCVVSMMAQFHESFERSARGIASSANRMVALLEVCEPLVLRYETHARDAATVARIAEHVGVPTAGGAADAVAGKLEASAVSAFIDRLVATGYFGEAPQVGQFHRETHWHPRHLGTGASGRYAEVLDEDQIAVVEGATEAYRQAFGYAD